MYNSLPRIPCSKLQAADAVLVYWRQAADAPAKERKRARDKSKERTERAPKDKRSRHHRDRGMLFTTDHHSCSSCDFRRVH
jgi:hypothetical protein